MKPLLLPWKGAGVPYGMIDVIRGCNCVCKTCYNRDRMEPKALDAVERDLDVLFAARRAEFVGLIGGEPLLHPQIREVVRLVKRRGVGAVLMTNGILWDEQMAECLAEDGLAMVYFHIQSDQRRPDLADDATPEEVSSLAARKCEIARKSGITAAVSATVRADRPAEMERMLRDFRANHACSHVFLTLERDMATIDAGVERLAATNGMKPCLDVLSTLGWRPFAGLGGRIDPASMRWIICHSYQRLDATGRETGFAALPPSLFEKTLFAFLRLAGLRVPVRTDPGRGAILTRIILNALTGGPVRNLAFALGALVRGERLARKNVFVEAFPDLLPDGRVECCDPCIDAVVKDGKLVPPCLSDTAFAEEVSA